MEFDAKKLKWMVLMISLVVTLIGGTTGFAIASDEPLTYPPRPVFNIESTKTSRPRSSSQGTESFADRSRRVEADLTEIVTFYDISISPTRINRLARFYKEELDSLHSIDFDALGQQDRVDYLLLRNLLVQYRTELEADRASFADVKPLFPFSTIIITLCEDRARVKPIQAQLIATHLDDLQKSVSKIHADVEAGKVTASKTNGYKASKIVTELREHLAETYKFYSSYDPQFDWWVTTPYKSADAALEGYISLVRSKVAGIKSDGTGDIVGEPIGRKVLLSELQAEVIAYSPEELVEIAEKQFKWSEQQMRKASKELGFGSDWKKALEHVKTDFVPPGEQPQLVIKLAHEAADFVRNKSLVTVPALAEETYRTIMIPAERQKVSPFFLGGPMIQISYPTNKMPQELKEMVMRSNNRHFARATVLHELIPGHRLQLFQAARYNSHRNLYYTPFFIEGWAVYWEFILYQRGDFFITPEDRIGSLFWRMHRSARIILTMKFHLGKIDAQECIEELVNRVGHERSAAEGEVRRWLNGDYGPLYQIAYMVGALQLLDLRNKVLGSGKMTEKAFHDTILTYGPIPNEFVRALLLDKELTADYKANWRFYGGT